MGGECAVLSPLKCKKGGGGGGGGSVINLLLIYLIKPGPAACRHLSLVEERRRAWGGVGAVVTGCQVYSAPPLHWAAAGGVHMRMEGRWEGKEEGGGKKGRVIKCRMQTHPDKGKTRGVVAIFFRILLTPVIIF